MTSVLNNRWEKSRLLLDVESYQSYEAVAMPSVKRHMIESYNEKDEDIFAKMRVEEGFRLIPFEEGNPYTTDTVLPGLLKRLLPYEVHKEAGPQLERLGKVIHTEMRAWSAKASEPRLVQYDHWGKRIDDLQTSEGWRGLKELIQKEGFVNIFYERKYSEYSRTLGFAMELLAVGDSQVVFCPMSMTDGASRVIELVGTPALKQEVIPRLVSRDPSIAFTAGQWMTERPGGSDVSQTETVATDRGVLSPYGPIYTLKGFKWFSSATDSDVALALARTGDPSLGSRSLSLFLIPMRIPLFHSPTQPRVSHLTNGIKIHRLKDKIGTKILPTAELELDETEGYLLGGLNQGVKLITPVLNITRIHSAISSAGYLRKCLAIATSYSQTRAIKSGKQLLKDAPLHVALLAKINLTYRALTHLVFGAIGLLGKVECNVSTKEEEERLRLLTPAVKAFGAYHASAAMEECMAALGGQGYMEEDGIGVALRDALAEKIWEGTVTVLALDVVRAASKPEVLKAFSLWADSVVASCPFTLRNQLATPLETLRTTLNQVISAYSFPIPELVPRPALLVFAHTAAALYLLEHAVWAHKLHEPSRDTDVEVFRRWVEEAGLSGLVDDLKVSKHATKETLEFNERIVYGDKGGNPAKAHL